MEKLLDLLSEEVGLAFEKAGYDRELGKVAASNRPDLCEYQDGSLPARIFKSQFRRRFLKGLSG